ncbi:hypothetical protein [Prosthecomicrobium sp. N25]|uniref:hypothetical protein n=1 Tax=Prosthecomicrobium sp. N25 TaxID=3129254 RepID=UPI003076FC81
MPAAPAVAIPIETRLAAAGLRLSEPEISKLASAVAELELSAQAIRRDRSYLEEPVHALRLWAK